MNAEAHRNLMSTSPCKPSGSQIKFVIVYLKCDVVGDVNREFEQVLQSQHISKHHYYVNRVCWKIIVWRSSLKLTEHTWPGVCPDRSHISGADCRQAEGEKNVLMENIRPRLKFGNKVEEVKLRKRKSQLYIKTHESHLDNGWALIFIYGAKTWINDELY